MSRVRIPSPAPSLVAGASGAARGERYPGTSRSHHPDPCASRCSMTPLVAARMMRAMAQASQVRRSPIGAIPISAILAARERIAGATVRTPILDLEADGNVQVSAKLENLEAICSFKTRGAGNALALADPTALAQGVYSASAGNLAQWVAW